jgi:hypothetical protein
MRKARGLLGIIVSSFLLLHAGGTIANADDHGNNGTIKVVSATDPGNDNDNDPKVCSFHIAGMNFDKSSSGTWSITGQGGNPGSGMASGTWAANASGAWQTANMTLPNGQYKVSAKQNGTPGGEKQKVFKVTCGQGTTGKAPETSTPSNNNGQGTGGNNGGGSQGGTNTPTASPSAGPSGGTQGFVNVPGTQSAGNASGAQGFSNLPSTSTASDTPIAAIGALLMAFGAFGALLLRRYGTQREQ